MMADLGSLEAIGRTVVEALKDKIGQNDLANAKEEWLVNKNSGKKMSTKYPHGRYNSPLISSIKYKIEGDEVVISMLDYAKYLEFGTPNPTTPDKILAWVNDKIMPDMKIKGKDKTKLKQKIAENIAKHISLYGPRPFPFIRTTLRELGLLDIAKINA